MSADERQLEELAAHGLTGEDARTTLDALNCSIAQGAPSIWDPLVKLDHLTDAELASTLRAWYGSDAVRGAVILYRWHNRAR